LVQDWRTDNRRSTEVLQATLICAKLPLMMVLSEALNGLYRDRFVTSRSKLIAPLVGL